jgi:hypothetical protein
VRECRVTNLSRPPFCAARNRWYSNSVASWGTRARSSADRAIDYGSIGRGFKSLRAHQRERPRHSLAGSFSLGHALGVRERPWGWAHAPQSGSLRSNVAAAGSGQIPPGARKRCPALLRNPRRLKGGEHEIEVEDELLRHVCELDALSEAWLVGAGFVINSVVAELLTRCPVQRWAAHQ